MSVNGIHVHITIILTQDLAHVSKQYTCIHHHYTNQLLYCIIKNYSD